MAVEVTTTGDVAVLDVSGVVDDRFAGFGDIGQVQALVINVAQMTRMTSFGVRQWLRALDALPEAVGERYIVGCPTFFVDQLNMVLDFAGGARVVTVAAPLTCASCGEEAQMVIDIVNERANLMRGRIPDKQCPQCKKTLLLDEAPDSYFAFIENYGAAGVRGDVARALSQRGLYGGPDTDKPPKIAKQIEGSVTYIRIIGTIGAMFRARSLLAGAEGEIVLDLGGVERFDPDGEQEWHRLLHSLATQVTALTIVDADHAMRAVAKEIGFVYSVLLPYRCTSCRRGSQRSHVLDEDRWPPILADQACAACGGNATAAVSLDELEVLRGVRTRIPEASLAMIERRHARVPTPARAPRGSPPPSMASDTLAVPMLGQVIGNFRIVGLLGRGGMGEVFRAEHTGIGTTVAIKVLDPEISADTQQVQRFFNEARAVGHIKHAGTVKIFDVGFHTNGSAYLIMELLDGESLGARIRRVGVLDIAQICDLGRQIASVLDATHAVGVIHRDLKPDNILIVPDAELASGERVKILDFGIAKLGGSLQGAGPRTVGTMGTPMYMAPEQWGDSGQVDWRADAYALGCVVFEMCTGQPPFAAPNIAAYYTKHLLEPVPPLDAHAVPAKLAVLVGELLAKEPRDRPSSMRHVLRAFEAIAAGAHIRGPDEPTLRPRSPTEPVKRDTDTARTTLPRRRRPSLASVIVALTILAIVILAILAATA